MDKYRELIARFLERGYESVYYSVDPPRAKALLLRHDIDFDVDYAWRMSLVEDELGVKATYFFLLHSKSYNLLAHDHLKQLRNMIERGHQVSIHFDPTLYEDIEAGFRKEKELFETILPIKVEFISIHRPTGYFLNNDETICGVRHTYQPRYFEQIKYFADSQGQFRYGDPIESEEFAKGDTIQLLIHPIWWVTQERDPLEKLHEFLDYRIRDYRDHMARNCKPYRQFWEARK